MANFIKDVVKTDSFEMNYVKFGEGEKYFVIIPGLSLTKVTDSAAGVAGAYNNFAEDYTVYLFDRKNNIEDGYSISDMADDTATAMKILGIKDAHVFGASQGGMIAQCLAAEYPELVSKVVLGSTTAKFSHMTNVIGEWVLMAEKKVVKAVNHHFIINAFSEEYVKKFGALLDGIESNGTAEDCKQFVKLAKACEKFDITDKLEKIKCPVLVLASKKDKIIHHRASKEIAEKLGCEIHLYEGYGHSVYDEAPDFKDRMLEFFKK